MCVPKGSRIALEGCRVLGLQVPLTADQQSLAESKRAELVERVAEADDELSELFLMEQPIDAMTLQDAIRRATLSLKFVPIFMGRCANVMALQ